MTMDGALSVERALGILRQFHDRRREMTLTEIARATGLYKSTALRLTASLERCGFLTRGEDLVYRLGSELWRLGSLYRRTLDIGEQIYPVLRAMTVLTGESSSFYVRDGDERICLYRQNSPRAVRHHLEEGERLPLDRGAAGHVLRAFSGNARGCDDKIRAAGSATSLGERDPDVAAVAVPAFDKDGHLVGALAVSGLISRFDAPARAKAIQALERNAAALRDTLPLMSGD